MKKETIEKLQKFHDEMESALYDTPNKEFPNSVLRRWKKRIEDSKNGCIEK
jgi:hypothetical protein